MPRASSASSVKTAFAGDPALLRRGHDGNRAVDRLARLRPAAFLMPMPRKAAGGGCTALSYGQQYGTQKGGRSRLPCPSSPTFPISTISTRSKPNPTWNIVRGAAGRGAAGRCGSRAAGRLQGDDRRFERLSQSPASTLDLAVHIRRGGHRAGPLRRLPDAGQA